MDNNVLSSFLLSFLAGISTLLGAFIIFFDKKNNNKLITKSLSFASGVMICVSLTDLLPNCYKIILNTNKYLPDNNKDNIYKIGIISMITIILHNIPEDCISYVS